MLVPLVIDISDVDTVLVVHHQQHLSQHLEVNVLASEVWVCSHTLAFDDASIDGVHGCLRLASAAVKHQQVVLPCIAQINWIYTHTTCKMTRFRQQNMYL